MTIIGMHASYPLVSPLLLSSSLLLIHDLGDSCKHGWGVQGWNLRFASASGAQRLQTFGSMSNLQCQNSDLAATTSPWRSNFAKEELPLVPRSPLQEKKTTKNESRRQKETLTWLGSFVSHYSSAGVIDCGGGIDFPSLSGEGVALRPSEDGKLAT